jgi:thioester reductase-like protein
VAKSFNDCVLDVTHKVDAFSNVIGAWMSKDGLSDLFAALTKNGHVPSAAEVENMSTAVTKLDELGLTMRQLTMQLAALKHQAVAARARTQKIAG